MDTPANVTHDGVRPHVGEGGSAANKTRARSLHLLGIYLTLSGLCLGIGGHRWLVIVHLTAVLIARGTTDPAGRTSRIIGDLLPLIVAPLLYLELPQLIAVLGTTYHDAVVQRWEIALFGGQPSRMFATVAPSTPFSELLHAGYLAYYGLMFIPPLILFARDEQLGFAQTVLALAATCLVCWTIFALFPVEGPRYLWVADGMPTGPVRRLSLAILSWGSARGAAFPSSHMAVSTVQTVMALRWQRRTGWIVAAIAVLVGVGAVYGGFHYGVDIVAGAALGAAIGAIVTRRQRASNDSSPLQTQSK